MSDFVTMIKAYWSIMQPEDAQAVALSFLATLILGCSIIGGFIWLANDLEAKRAVKKRKEEDEAVEKALAVRAARQGRPYVKAPPTAAGGKAAMKPRPKGKELPKPPEGQSRHIPIEAQEALILRGREQLAASKPDKALVTYLTLLYSAAESRDGKSLPANLTECLRGAAECYRKLGDPENAVKFLQAERRIFEEVVVSAANAGRAPGEKRRPGGILQSLLNPGAALEEEDLPRRCQTLTEVAEACTKLERHDVALAYRVKAAAVKQKVTGKALDEKSPEFITMAAALAKVKELGLGSEAALKEATRGENAVATDNPLMQMLQQRKELTELAQKASEAAHLGPSAGPPEDAPPADEEPAKDGAEGQ